MSTVTQKALWGVGATLLSSTFYGLSTVIIKLSYRLELKPMEVLGLQAWSSSFILLVIALIFKREVFRQNRKTLSVLAVQGLLGSLASSILIFNALHYLPVPVAMVLLYTYPAIVLGAGVLLWDKMVSSKEWLALGLTLAGNVIASGILFTNVTVSVIGLIIGLGSAVAYSVLNLGGEVAMRQVSPVAVLMFSQWFSGLGLLLYFRGDITSLPWQRPELWMIGFVLAVFASIIPFYLLMIGIKYIGSDKAAIISTFELPMSYLFAMLILKEWPTLGQWVGGSLVFAGIILLNWRSKNEQPKEASAY